MSANGHPASVGVNLKCVENPNKRYPHPNVRRGVGARFGIRADEESAAPRAGERHVQTSARALGRHRHVDESENEPHRPQIFAHFEGSCWRSANRF